MAERTAMITRTHTYLLVRPMPDSGTGTLDGLHQPRPVSPDDLALIHRIDEVRLAYPFAGSWLQTKILKCDGTAVGCRHFSTLMKRMSSMPCITSPTPASNIRRIGCIPTEAPSDNHPFQSRVGGGHHLHPDATRGFVSLFSAQDRASRWVLAWWLANRLATDCCMEAVQDEMTREGAPEIFNTDPGCQFTSLDVAADRPRHPDQYGWGRLLA